MRRLTTRGEEEHVHSMSSMFLLKPTKHTYTPLSLTDKGPLKHRQREDMLRIYMPDRYRRIDSMVSHWECRRSLWEHPGREKAGSSQPPGGDARTIMTCTCVQTGGDRRPQMGTRSRLASPCATDAHCVSACSARPPATLSHLVGPLLIPWTSSGHEIPPC